MKIYENWRYSPTIIDLGTRWSWVVRFTFQSHYSRENHPRYPLDRGLGGFQSRSERCRREKNLMSLLGIEHRKSSL
jgi:hypothetical protein